MCEDINLKGTVPGIVHSESGDLVLEEKEFRKREHQRCLPMALESTEPIMTKRELYVLTFAAAMLPAGCFAPPEWLDKHGPDVIEAAEKMADMMLGSEITIGTGSIVTDDAGFEYILGDIEISDA